MIYLWAGPSKRRYKNGFYRWGHVTLDSVKDCHRDWKDTNNFINFVETKISNIVDFIVLFSQKDVLYSQNT